MQTFLDTPADCQWLRETHLAPKRLFAPEEPVPGFDSCVLHGHETGPDKMELYSLASPTIHDTPVAVYQWDSESDLYRRSK